ncbi:MAG: Transcriptional regulator, XRE family [Candidatus Gottesmanbacteria bacterium GW2011_GWA1_47_8]|uniref:Transcriptional regulator, XRE family n=1 Tax=Candidatus Gottesmanbacteria bacterium GW2011_GWA1_47_8 TaxID=1618438 RepID=A0A0G1TFU1_9BACT|nr:MAG: Transcriptional regulator, XRE family [Candidatus Gottesmanbacteria bacterium GW2011_GWA1_47_8]
MKTVGEVLNTARRERDLSTAEIAKTTKIEEKYIQALERNDFAALPSTTFIKGFIRNYAQVVDRSPEEMIALFRRDFAHKSPQPKIATTPLGQARGVIGKLLGGGNLVLFAVGVLVFLGYLAYQYRAILVVPPLEIAQPAKQAVVTSPVLVEGKTSADSLVSVAEEVELRPDSNGVFSTSLNLSPGDHQLIIRAVNRFGRQTQLEVPITVISGN